MNRHRIPTCVLSMHDENKRQRENRARCPQYWTLQAKPPESLMNLLQFHANGYQGDFIPLAFYRLSQERCAAQRTVNSR